MGCWVLSRVDDRLGGRLRADAAEPVPTSICGSTGTATSTRKVSRAVGGGGICQGGEVGVNKHCWSSEVHYIFTYLDRKTILRRLNGVYTWEYTAILTNRHLRTYLTSISGHDRFYYHYHVLTILSTPHQRLLFALMLTEVSRCFSSL